MYSSCNFIPPKDHRNDFDFYHFVYETQLKKLAQPFNKPHFCMNLAFRGNAVLETEGAQYPLCKGTLFFTFPQQTYSILEDQDFTFLYISFNGSEAYDMLKNLGIDKKHAVYSDFEHILEFWMSGIRRINSENANTLTESVLMYTLSYISNTKENTFNNPEKFDSILKYINYNFTARDMSVRKVADIFFYSEKYLSSLFIRKKGVKFTQHINELRIYYAIKLLKENNTNISDIAYKCGYTDPLYFSKVFKKITQKTPTEYIKEIKK